jgi:hypothetical protein
MLGPGTDGACAEPKPKANSMSATRNHHYSVSRNGGLSQEFMDEVTRRIEEREALHPSLPPPPEVPWPDKPHALVTAEKEMRRWETCRTLGKLLCEHVGCTRAYCGRHKRCLKLDEIDAEIARVRTQLNALQAKWPAPNARAPEIAPEGAVCKKKRARRRAPLSLQ